MYYLRQQTKVSGPFSVEQLKSLLYRGRVARSDKISTDKQMWTSIADCAEITQRPAAASQSAAPAAGVEWFYTQGGAEQPTAVGTDALKAMIAAGVVGDDEMVWRQGFEEWRTLRSVAEFADVTGGSLPAFPDFPGAGTNFPGASGLPVVTMPIALPMPGPHDYQTFIGKKVPAGVVAILLGALGIHKFMLGLNTGGLVMLLACIFVIPIPILTVIGIAEGVTYLTKSDEAFYQDYAVAKKQWL